MSGFGPIEFLKKIVGANDSSRRDANKVAIAVGDKFEQLHEGMPIWTVERVSRVSMSSFPLISMFREDHPELTKTVSLTALEDGEDYRPAIQ
ncbi:MAG: hypothetical protein JKY57_04660 [Kordiimonadaceae bacterium]|nr:hypothetical protein [Kordiimonadaceae bacterium]